METPETKLTKKIENPAMKAFFDEALAWIQREKAAGKEPASIELGSPQWAAWRAYLVERTGAVPAVMRMAEKNGSGTMTMPTEWPHWFDVRSVPQAVQPPTKRPEPTPEERRRVEAGFERLKRELRSANLSMKNPKPLPEERITRTLAGSIERDETRAA
jgi:hypothetical protein